MQMIGSVTILVLNIEWITHWVNFHLFLDKTDDQVASTGVITGPTFALGLY
jgi:hypothetical protein